MSVYFAQREDGGPIKIGCSAYVADRLAQLSCNHKAKLVLLASAPGNFRDEGRMHRQLEAHALGREWFEPHADVLALVDYVRSRGRLPPVPQDDRDVVLARRYLGGETLQSIANDYGITRERVRQILRTLGVPSLGLRPQHAHRPTAPATVNAEHVVALYNAGLGTTEIAAEIDDNVWNVRNALKRAGCKLEMGRNRKPETAVKAAEAARLYQQGVRTVDIAERIGCGQPSIYRFLRIAGVTPSRQAA